MSTQLEDLGYFAKEYEQGKLIRQTLNEDAKIAMFSERPETQEAALSRIRELQIGQYRVLDLHIEDGAVCADLLNNDSTIKRATIYQIPAHTLRTLENVAQD